VRLVIGLVARSRFIITLISSHGLVLSLHPYLRQKYILILHWSVGHMSQLRPLLRRTLLLTRYSLRCYFRIRHIPWLVTRMVSFIRPQTSSTPLTTECHLWRLHLLSRSLLHRWQNTALLLNNHLIVHLWQHVNLILHLFLIVATSWPLKAHGLHQAWSREVIDRVRHLGLKCISRHGILGLLLDHISVRLLHVGARIVHIIIIAWVCDWTLQPLAASLDSVSTIFLFA
jgi:hypothetical protein